MGCGIMFPRDFCTDGDGSLTPAFTVLLTDQSLTCCVWVFFFPDSDETDDWDFEVFSKPSEVQNDLYASNEDEEEEVEDVDGKKVMVRSLPSLNSS